MLCLLKRDEVELHRRHIEPVYKPGHVINGELMKIAPFLSDILKEQLQTGAVRTERVASVPSIVEMLEIPGNGFDQRSLVIEDNVPELTISGLDFDEPHPHSFPTAHSLLLLSGL